MYHGVWRGARRVVEDYSHSSPARESETGKMTHERRQTEKEKSETEREKTRMQRKETEKASGG